VVLVGVDGSSGSRAALRWAIGEARLRGVRVTAICVHERPWSAGAAGPYGGMVVADMRATLAEQAQALLRDEVCAALASEDGVPVTQVVAEGPAAKALLNAAQDADLLVVGSRGRGGFAGLLLGSVGQQCAHHARCPVVIVPNPQDPDQAR
jgi:nucleotide-binding universal stress UspA family protein